MSKLINLQTNMGHLGDRIQGRQGDAFGTPDAYIAMFTVDEMTTKATPITLSLVDSEGSVHWQNKTVSIPKSARQVAAIFRVPPVKSEHTVTLKGKIAGSEITKQITVYP